jgi:proton glutamate symport protein
MSETAEDAPARPLRGARAWLVLLALIAGLLGGLLTGAVGGNARDPLVSAADLVGGLWLDALRMTVVPLIVALLVTGVAKGADAASGGGIAGRTVGWIVAVCTASAAFGLAAMTLLTRLVPLAPESAAALRAGLDRLDPAARDAPVPSLSDFFSGIIPDNVFAAASGGQVLPLVVFAILFALALLRVGAGARRSVLALFEGIADALLVIVGWVLWIAPVGVFALGFSLAASAGSSVFAGLVHYILLVSTVGLLVMLAAYPIAILAGRRPPAAFARAMLPAQSVAVSTRSSLASLPAMIGSARMLGVRDRVSDISLPLAVALFRATGPAMNTAVVIYAAYLMGIPLNPVAVLAAFSVAAVVSYGSVSLPGEISFITSIGPIALAMGVPIAPLALLVAVEMIPDIFRTLGNVTMDVAVTTAVDRGEGPENEPAS